MPRLVATVARSTSNFTGVAPSTPTSHSFAILPSPTSSPSVWPSSLQQICGDIQPHSDIKSDYLLSPLASSPALVKTKQPPSQVVSSSHKANFSSDHEYGQFSAPLTPSSSNLTPSSSSAQRRVYMTPTSIVGGSSGRRTTSTFVMSTSQASASAVKTEARRRLNLDTAPVDREGFKTPIKATKRRQDCSSSPSPKKSKILLFGVYSFCALLGQKDPNDQMDFCLK